jgi:2-oxo-4-hydroxy-4-carboxy-5-ureidoimidazoline decarboxylase
MTKISQMDRQTFLDNFAGIYEHSSWIAEQTWDKGLSTAEDTARGLRAMMIDVVDAAGREPQLALLRAHPDLAGKLAINGELTAESTSEQASAGLDKCTLDEFNTIQSLNERYKTRFGFPYILAVKGRNVPEIIENFSSRVDNDIETEFSEALSQVHQIALLRLDALI